MIINHEIVTIVMMIVTIVCDWASVGGGRLRRDKYVYHRISDARRARAGSDAANFNVTLILHKLIEQVFKSSSAIPQG